jgi:hypothetical protein
VNGIVVVVLVMDVALTTTILAMHGFTSIDPETLLAAPFVHFEMLHACRAHELEPSSTDIANQTVPHDRSGTWATIPWFGQCMFIEGLARVYRGFPFRFPDYSVCGCCSIRVAEHPSGVYPVIKVAEEIHKDLFLHAVRGFAHGCLFYIP